jgi:hypothetical protein
MVAELLPVFAPIPSSVAKIARRLPAHLRARVEWFPQALRRTFIEPLARASPGEFHVRLDELTVDAVRTVLQLVASLGELTAILVPEVIARAIEPSLASEAPRHASDDLIRQHLEPHGAIAADDLREAHAWLRAILSATAITLGPALEQLDVTEVGPLRLQLETLGDADIRREIFGEVRVFFRGLLLTIGALDALERAELPDTIVAWCALALTELHASANMLRASGIPVPTDVPISGYSAMAWRERRRRQGARVVPALLDIAYLDDAQAELEAFDALVAVGSRFAAFHLEQAAEKLIRAVRIHHKLVVTSTHDLVLLVDGHPGDSSKEPRPLPDGDPWRARMREHEWLSKFATGPPRVRVLPE